jgi:hypothetical protein
MSRFLTGVLLLLPLAALADDAKPGDAKPADPKAARLKPDDNLPGSFLPYNATGASKGRFHCLISDYSLEPGVVVVVRDLEPSEALKDLLKQLDERISKNPAARLHAFAVFLTDDKTNVVTSDDRREQLATALENLSNSLMLKNVVLCLDSPKDAEKYTLEDAWATVVLYNKYRIVATYGLPKADGKAEVEKILADVGEKLKAAKTK